MVNEITEIRLMITLDESRVSSRACALFTFWRSAEKKEIIGDSDTDGLV